MYIFIRDTKHQKDNQSLRLKHTGEYRSWECAPKNKVGPFRSKLFQCDIIKSNKG